MLNAVNSLQGKHIPGEVHYIAFQLKSQYRFPYIMPNIAVAITVEINDSGYAIHIKQYIAGLKILMSESFRKLIKKFGAKLLKIGSSESKTFQYSKLASGEHFAIRELKFSHNKSIV